MPAFDCRIDEFDKQFSFRENTENKLFGFDLTQRPVVLALLLELE